AGVVVPLARGGLLALPIVLPFALLLAAADTVFALRLESLLRLGFLDGLSEPLGHGAGALAVAWLCAGGPPAALRPPAPRGPGRAARGHPRGGGARLTRRHPTGSGTRHSRHRPGSCCGRSGRLRRTGRCPARSRRPVGSAPSRRRSSCSRSTCCSPGSSGY